MLASPALFHRLGVQYIGDERSVRRTAAGNLPSGVRAAGRSHSTRQYPATPGVRVMVTDEGAQATAIQRAIGPEAGARFLFALVLAVTALLIVGQAATRLLATGFAEQPAVPQALGMTRSAAAGSGADRGRGGRVPPER